jgi:hypothetical protein
MSIAALLHELEAAGIRLHAGGDTLCAEIAPSASLDPFRDRIRAVKPALLDELQSRKEPAALGLDPALRWNLVYRGPVEASTRPEGWGGVAPAGCGVPHACCVLGPCPHFNEQGRCWKVKETR